MEDEIFIKFIVLLQRELFRWQIKLSAILGWTKNVSRNTANQKRSWLLLTRLLAVLIDHGLFQVIRLGDGESAILLTFLIFFDLGEPHLTEEPKIIEIGKAHKKNSAQVLIRYQVQRGNIVIPKSVTKSRIISNIDVFDFALSDEEMKVIDAFDRNGRLCPESK